jgi:putative tricarboxylic transport membrane protein
MYEIIGGIGNIFTPWPLFLTVLGTILGIVVGAIPGLTGAMLIALTLPLTYYMSPVNAMILLISMYVGSISGGQVASILLGMPGAPSAVMTTFDGFPMARAGKPGRALGLGIGASFFGGLVSWTFLVLLARPLSEIAVRFGPFEYFALVLMAMVLIASISQGSMIKGILSGFLGMLVAMPGVDPSSGGVRLTFGFHAMDAGFRLLPVLMGVFAVGQITTELISVERRVSSIKMSMKGILMSLKDWKSQAVNLLRSSLIGTWVGILPAIGGNIGSVLSYTAAKNMSKSPERFGKGAEEGIIASETANNATIGGALIPLIAMGIPGSVINVFLLAALLVHGIQPGPLLFTSNPEIVYTIFATMFVANIFMFLIMTGTVKYIAKVSMVPKAYILPVILVFCIIGSYAQANRMFDVWVLLIFGVVGFVMSKASIPRAPSVIGLVLTPIAEQNFRTGLMISGGSLLPLFTRPVSLIFLLISVLFLIWPLISAWRRRKKSQAN